MVSVSQRDQWYQASRKFDERPFILSVRSFFEMTLAFPCSRNRFRDCDWLDVHSSARGCHASLQGAPRNRHGHCRSQLFSRRCHAPDYAQPANSRLYWVRVGSTSQRTHEWCSPCHCKYVIDHKVTDKAQTEHRRGRLILAKFLQRFDIRCCLHRDFPTDWRRILPDVLLTADGLRARDFDYSRILHGQSLIFRFSAICLNQSS